MKKAYELAKSQTLRVVVLLGLGCFLAVPASAEPQLISNPEIQRAFSADALSLPRALLAKNVREVQGISVEKISKKISQVRWLVLTEGYTSPNDNRTSGVNFSDRKLAVISAESFNQAKDADSKRILILHEALGASGFEDHDYDLSLSILEASKTGIAPAFRNSLRARGVSGVGGGGDLGGIKLKVALLAKYHCQRRPGAERIFAKCVAIRGLITNAQFTPYFIGNGISVDDANLNRSYRFSFDGTTLRLSYPNVIQLTDFVIENYLDRLNQTMLEVIH